MTQNQDGNSQDQMSDTSTVNQSGEGKTKEQLLEEQLEEMRKQNQLFAAQLNQTNQTLQTLVANGGGNARREPEPPAPITIDDYNQNPVETISKIVERQTAPLQQAAFQMMRQNALQAVKDNLSAKYQDFKHLESIWYNLMGNVTNITLEAAESVYIMAKGAYAQQYGKLPDANGNGNGSGNNNSSIVPPHLRPSKQPANDNNGGNGLPKLEPLNESEERLRRENGLTHAEYLFYGGRLSQQDFDKHKAAR